MNPDLLRLAGAAGIEDGYWDGLGVRRDLREPTAAALLAALGLDPTADLHAQCEVLADAPFVTPLPPAVAASAGPACSLLITLPSTYRDEAIPWTLELENGNALHGVVVASQLPLVDERESGARRYRRYRVELGADIPQGYHRFCLPTLAAGTLLIAAPARCFIPEALAHGARRWGLAVQLYAVRSARNWGVGDFGDLAVLATAAGRAGAAFIGLNPLHARPLTRPEEASPYSPASRLFLDPVYIDIPSVPEFAACTAAREIAAAADFQGRLAEVRAAPLVDYPAVTALKLGVLECMHAYFKHSADACAARQLEFEAFVQRGGAPLARYAEFEARSLHAQPTASHMDFQLYLQWLAAAQLDAAGAAARASGMPIGLYRDLAVGAAHGSAEYAGEPRLYAPDTSIGAPPDMLNRQGQDWGLPPWNPRALEQLEFAPFRALLAANMRNTGALRIDHVMALTRLFWIPRGMSGADGGYVRYPFAILATILALESVRNRCMVIGEDLGSVPDGLRTSLCDWGLLSYRVLFYERHWQGDGRFCQPHEYPRQALATVATHDMPTITDYWRGADIERRAALGMYPSPQELAEDAARRHVERDGILRLLGEIGLSPDDPANAAQVIESLHGAVARTAAMLAAVQLDDLIGETEPINIPGTYREYPNWRRKLSLPIETIVGDARWERLAAIMRETGRSQRSSPE